jgi:ribonuclease inhibitor
MKATIGNPPITSAAQFHEQIADAMQFPDYYGENLDALWEVLTDNVERPFTLIWLDAARSQAAMPEDFAVIVQLFGELASQDREDGVSEFALVLR